MRRSSTGRPKLRWWLPREHGAYAQLLFPLVTGLALAGFEPVSLLLCAGVVVLFLAHEPLLVTTGGRGGRAQRELGARARRVALERLLLGLVAAGVALVLAPGDARLAALLPAGFAATLVPLSLTRRVRTLAGELVVSFALSTALIPVALTGSAALRTAAAAAGVWAVIFTLATLGVRSLIAGAKGREGAEFALMAVSMLALAAAVAGVGVAALGLVQPAISLAVLLPAAAVLTCTALRVHPRHLRRVGWTFVVADLAALICLLVGLV